MGQDKSFHHENFPRFVFAANENFEITGFSSFRLRANYDNRDYLENTPIYALLKGVTKSIQPYSFCVQNEYGCKVLLDEDRLSQMTYRERYVSFLRFREISLRDNC